MTSLPLVPNRTGRVLVASPSSVIRQRVLADLRIPSCRVEQASGGAEALVRMESDLWQTLFLDRHLPDLDADELSATIRQRFPETEVVMLDAEASPKTPSASQQNGPRESWREERPEESVVAAVVGSILEAPLPGMIGASRSMLPVYRAARLLARRDTTVLISGPTGSGKELVARAIHNLSARAGRSFVVVNCAAIPETLLESELFGHVRGAFTGAMQSYSGRIQAGQGGTCASSSNAAWSPPNTSRSGNFCSASPKARIWLLAISSPSMSWPYCNSISPLPSPSLTSCSAAKGKAGT